MQKWDSQFAARSPMFAPLRCMAQALAGAAWPGPPELNALASRNAVQSGGGRPLQFAAMGSEPAPGAADYEARIHDQGEVPLRPANWHDLFNALVWLAFPRAKAALNRGHVEALRARPVREGGQRPVRRDALTLLDESGVLVLSSDIQVLQRIRDFEWKRLFVDERETLLHTTRFMLFGHGLYEKALSPYVGMTGHALLLHWPQTPEMEAGAVLQAHADDLAAAALTSQLAQPRDLSPLPVLGVPGWWDANRDAAFYDNTDYFRPGRRGRR
jgi:Protein of unknown function (DUF3025)